MNIDIPVVTNKNAEASVPFLLDEIIHAPGISDFIKDNYERGINKVFVTKLKNKLTALGLVFVYPEQLDNLSDHFKSVIPASGTRDAYSISNTSTLESNDGCRQELTKHDDHQEIERRPIIHNFPDIVGNGHEMQKVYRMMSLVAGSNSTVLLLGETGTGKELIARAIHNSSPRKNKPMVKVNCAALPVNLIESELFGHEKGSFTGAVERRIGKFEQASNGTLFLDEIGEMPLETQVKLLRAIQEREIERVGGKAPVKVDVRIIAATNRNLEAEVKAGRFRSDLYYRLNVFPIVLPPLRDRIEDIAPLANLFLERYSQSSGRNVLSISTNVLQELKHYPWPGNVRELEHLIERSILFTEGNVLCEIQLSGDGKDKDLAANSTSTLEQIERTYIIETLKKCDGKISGKGGAAELLEIPSTTLHSKMKKLTISKADYFRNTRR
jgi:transcriptional regulator with GAF, ATPase, and Fis domain